MNVVLTAGARADLDAILAFVTSNDPEVVGAFEGRLRLVLRRIGGGRKVRPVSKDRPMSIWRRWCSTHIKFSIGSAVKRLKCSTFTTLLASL